ncbi:zinc finger MYND domain-containing protein [Sporobolomyces salmoneus]|uniref:zinc finger MYND domain-containing protein n=1 Tax=Sporobolomyces salmoneus TaxID=183962 RepID=UPI00317BE41A
MSADQSSKSDSSGECVVCGKKCLTRCSACSSHGLDWMFFCSKEHQKLIWSVHKRFCGVNSSPLHWPLISDSEADEAREVLKELRREQSGSTTRAKELEGLGFVEAPGRAPASLESILPHILESSESGITITRQSRSGYVAAFRRGIWRIERKLAASRFWNREQSTKWMFRAMARDPLSAVVQQHANIEAALLSAAAVDSPSSTLRDTLTHKILILFTIVSRAFEIVSDLPSALLPVALFPPSLIPFVRYTQQEVIRYCDKIFDGIPPELALPVRQDLQIVPPHF